MKIKLISALALFMATAASAQTPASPPSRWQISEETTALTGARFFSGAIESDNQILNMLGRSDRASLVIRCSEGGLAVYVNWPQVVSQDGENFVGDPKTMAIWRIDDGKIQGNLWDIDSTGTAAGEFKRKNAAKMLASLVTAKKLVVRLTGQQTQDAQFDLSGINSVAANAAAVCGQKL